ncbi:MAG: penicillin-binding protein 2 [Anaerolineales bacterium]|nr:penicillin-binding protein 2 [Anaerolineales bacterium]
MIPTSLPYRRVSVLLVIMGMSALAMFIQLIRVQFGPYAPVFSTWIEAAEDTEDEIEPMRGLIYDRDGDLLATNVPMYYLEVEVFQLTQASRKQIAAVLARTLVLPYEDLYNQLNTDWGSLGQYRIRLTREVDGGERWPITIDQVAADVLKSFLLDPEAPDLSGLKPVAAPKREYPASALAGHVLGFVNQEGKGYFGIEGFYDNWLGGKAITVERGYIPPEARVQPDTPTGVNLVLTLDLDIQQMTDDILRKAIEDSGSEAGQIIIMDPRNGEILAMAILPSLDPNNYEPWLAELGFEAEDLETEEEELVINPAVGGQFEPGSTFKILTMAAAIDAGVIEPEDQFIDRGVIEVGGVKIRNWNGGAWGPQTMVGCIQHSLNVCLAYVASEKLGAASFYEYLTAFGMGRVTGIDLSGEVSGQMRTPRHPEWTQADLGTNSFGQGISVTPVQLIAAVGAVANEGVMVQPHIVRAVVGPEGAYWPKSTTLGRPISAESARTITEMLVQSVEGEARDAHVNGYEIAGKTGTAQIPTENGYDDRWTIASFIGWGPVSDPRFVVLVRLDKPESSPWGSVVAAPVFRDVVERLVAMLEIPPDSVREQLAAGD